MSRACSTVCWASGPSTSTPPARIDSEFRFEWVNNPEQVVRAVDQAVEEARAAASERGPGPAVP